MKPKVLIDHSKFWLGEKYDPTKALQESSVLGLLRLSGYRRAIANFVYILTGKNIPVRFAEKTTSLTDGKVIYIGGELSRGEFDPTVGLSLHEAMHIVKSDFNVIKTLWGKLPRSLREAANGKISDKVLGDYAKYVLNVIEDRYIDAWAYDAAPGYRGYYDALYTRYFYDPKIGEALKSDAYREPTLLNYRFRFTNLVNPASDLDALPVLRKIAEMLDVDNILRSELASPEDRRALAFQITEEIVKSVVEHMGNKQTPQPADNTAKDSSDDTAPADDAEESSSGESKPAPVENSEQDQSEPSDDESESGDEEEPDAKEETPEDTSESDKEEKSDSGEEESEQAEETDASASTSKDPFGGVEATSEPVIDDINEKEENPSKDLSEKEIAAVEKLIEKQVDFNRETKQQVVEEDTLEKLRVLEQSDATIVLVGNEEGVPEVPCVVVKNMTRELMLSKEFPYSNRLTSDVINPDADKGVEDGIVLGTMLGRRLQIRGEVNTTRFTRLPKGKIDRRLLSSLGFNSEDVFYQTLTDKYKNVHLHVTVDASGSMVSKWRKTMTTVVAIAKAASMINNVTVSISFRSGVTVGNDSIWTKGTQYPYVVIAYDSRHDHFSKIIQLFPMLFAGGSTPEGLTFQAIANLLPPTTHELDSYFVNLSDGVPAFDDCYFGEIAARHTKKQVGKIREMGIMVLSYFIEGDDENSNMTNMLFGDANTLFQTMYGKDAQFIDVSDITQIAHTMNRRFLVKES